LDSFDGLDPFEKLLVGFRVLDDDFGLPVNRQDQRITGLLDPVEKF